MMPNIRFSGGAYIKGSDPLKIATAMKAYCDKQTETKRPVMYDLCGIRNEVNGHTDQYAVVLDGADYFEYERTGAGLYGSNMFNYMNIRSGSKLSLAVQGALDEDAIEQMTLSTPRERDNEKLTFIDTDKAPPENA